MAISLPNLDDRTYNDLVAEMRALIPRYAPDWTDHNVTDPGIMLIELFAWLTEAMIYRLNRIPEASEIRFLELLGAAILPAQPASVDLTVTAQKSEELDEEEGLPVPAGTRLLADPGSGKAPIRFETVETVYLTSIVSSAEVRAIQMEAVTKELVGVSNGEPHQLFPLRCAFVTLRPDEQWMGEPQLIIDEQRWSYRPNLLDSSSNQLHFTVEPFANAIRFGSDTLGAIPPIGADIFVDYRFTLGSKGSLPPDVTFKGITIDSMPLSIHCRGTSPGSDPTGLDEARQQAIQLLENRYRAVTAADFEAIILAESKFDVARVRCLPEYNGEVETALDGQEGHVTVVIVPSNPADADKPVPDDSLVDAVWGFLDERRLLTCRHHVVGPTFTDIRVCTEVVSQPTVEAASLQDTISKTLRDFFHPLPVDSHPAWTGWTFGHHVYASEVYQVLETVGGVDHVESLVLKTRVDGEWQPAGNVIEIGPDSLIYFDGKASVIEVRSGQMQGGVFRR